MKKTRVSYYLSDDLIERLNEVSRKDLPNRSKLIEELLEKWLEERQEIDKKVSNV